MAMTVEQAQTALQGDLYGEDGTKIGKIGQIFLEDATGEPGWLTVTTGFFGSKQSFVPLDGAVVGGADITVAYDKDTIKGAPNVDPEDGHLSEADEDRLFRYYGMVEPVGDDGATSRTSAGFSTSDVPTSNASVSNASVSNASLGDDAMTRSEERLRVGTERVVTGRARLRKLVVTETASATVRLRTEHARLVHEPIADGDVERIGVDTAFTPEERVIDLMAERPVVATEVVPVERVSLQTVAETHEETVSGRVRKERIALEGDVAEPVTGRHA